MLESMGVVESSISDHFSPEIHKKMSSQPLPLSDLNHTCLNPHPAAGEKSQIPGTKQMKGREALVPSVPCVLVITGYLGAYSIMRGRGGRENTNKTTSVTVNLLTSIYLLPLAFLPLTPPQSYG